MPDEFLDSLSWSDEGEAVEEPKEPRAQPVAFFIGFVFLVVGVVLAIGFVVGLIWLILKLLAFIVESIQQIDWWG